jgi:biopolymer transport protein ExbD
MAGVSVGESDENPVAINVTAMVDIIFCLCVFYMCSFKFKMLEGKFDSWLPKDKGTGGVGDANQQIQEIRVALYWDEASSKTTRRFFTRTIENDAELQQVIHDQHADNLRLGRTDVPVIIDAEAKVPMAQVVNVMNLAKREGIANIEFALGKPMTSR